MALEGQVRDLIGDVGKKLLVGEEEEEGFVIEEEIGEEEEEWDLRWAMVGRFVTEKLVKLSPMQTTMGDLWKPGKGLFVKEIEPNRFLFQFFHEVDVQRAIEGGPWTFDNALLVWKRVTPDISLKEVELNEGDFWVQLHKVQKGMKTVKVCEVAGNYVGRYIKSDPRNFDGDRAKEFLRVRVSVNVKRPLKKTMKLRKEGGDWFWVEFKYERLPSFCFICGIIGHGERFCDVLYDRPELATNKPFSAALRAPSKTNVPYILPVSKWLCNSKGERLYVAARDGGSSSGGEGGGLNADFSGVNVTVNVVPDLEVINQGGGGFQGRGINTGDNDGVVEVDHVEAGLIRGNEEAKFKEAVMVDAISQEEEEEGVVLTEAKRKRVDGESLNLNKSVITGEGIETGLLTKPSGPAGLIGPRVGPAEQAHLA